MQQSPTSKSFQLDRNDLSKVGKGLLIAALGGLITAVPEQMQMIDWGPYAPIAFAVSSMLVNLLRKLIANNSNN